MHRTFIAPSAYVQGPDVIGEPAHLDHLTGERAYVIGGETALSVVGSTVSETLQAAGIEIAAVDDDVAACTENSLTRYSARRDECAADLVVGVGGGVALDVATAISTGPFEFVSVPTIASTDAPCSTVSVVYDDDGNFRDVRFRDRNPDLVLVDSKTIAESPTRFLRHGMGDAFATRFEAEAAAATTAETAAGGRPSHAGLAIARECHRTLVADGVDAVAASQDDTVTPALERVIETNVLLSGLGFENGGTAGAHAIQIGLTNAGVRKPHGLLVGFGTIAELVLQDHDELSSALELARQLGLDTTLADFGASNVDLEEVGAVACEHGMDAEPVETTPTRVATAIQRADELLRTG